MRFFFCFALLLLVVSATGAGAKPAVPHTSAKVMPNSSVMLHTQLRAAIRANNVRAVAALMKRGARPDADVLGEALYTATLPTWKTLFVGGVSVNALVNVADEDGAHMVPLIVAVASQSADDENSLRERALLRELIARGANVNAHGKNGENALYAATENAHDDGQTAQILFNAGVHVAPDDAWLLQSAARLGNVALLQRALQRGVSVTSTVARERHLLQNAIDIRRQSLNEDTPLLEVDAAKARHKIVVLLLGAGAEINDLDERGQTPLMLAADGGLRPALVELLLKRGANPDLRQAKGPTLWDYALPTRFNTKAQIEAALQFDPFAFGDTNYSAAQVLARQTAEDTRTLELLLDAGADLETCNPQNQTALLRAALLNRAGTIRFLLGRGAKLGAADNAGNSALHLAAGSDSPDAIGALLDAGADIEARNKNELTPLLVAAGAGISGMTFYGPLSTYVEGYSGGPEALRVLVARGANLEAQDKREQTALHWMARNGDTKNAQLLAQRGANVNARAEDGVTPLHLAVTQGDYPMTRLLLQLGADATLKAEGKTPLDIAREPYVTQMNVVGEDPAHPSRETREMLAQLQKRDAQITARRQEIARLLERAG